MKISRRSLIRASASAAVLKAIPAHSQFMVSGAPRSTLVQMGALSGGGYVQGLGFSDDGQTMVINYDGANCWIWNSATSQFDNLFSQSRLPNSMQGWGQGTYISYGFNCPAIAVAPSDANRIYAIARGSSAKAAILKMTARGGSWVDTGFCLGLATASNRGQGPTLVVDPKNPDHVLASDDAGAIWETTDGFSSDFRCLNAPGGSLAGVLPQAQTNAATATGGTVLSFLSGTIPAAVTSPPSGFGSWASDVSKVGAFNISENVSATTATSVTLNNAIVGSGVGNGDVIVFGMRAGIAFDRTSPYVNGKTQGVYIGWGYGASGVYHSTDGCASFTQLAGGPTYTRYIACSNDGVVYVCEYGGTSDPATSPWRYQSSAWTHLTNLTSSQGNAWNCVAPDPNSVGHVCFVTASGNLNMSGDYGATFSSGPAGYDANYNKLALPRTSTDVAWLGPFVIPTGTSLNGTLENWMSNGVAVFDPVVSGRMWLVEGIGVWYCSPIVNPGASVTTPLTGRNKNAQTIILNQIVKPSGGPLYAASQDRGGYRLTDPTQEPTGDFGYWETGALASIVSGWCVDYAKSNASFVVLTSTGGTWTSSNGGLSWAKNANTSIGYQAQVACQSSTSFVLIPNTGSPVYTTDGGATFNNCLFGGTTLTTGWQGYYWNRHIICADMVNAGTYYAYNLNNDTTGGMWRSTDGGANWTNMTGGVIQNGAVKMNTGAVDQMVTAVVGQQGHLLIGGGSAYNNSFPLMWSINGGAPWIAVPGTGVAWMACAGKAAPGALYPAIYFAGTCTTDPNPTDPGVFVAYDFDPTNTGRTPTWHRLCRAPAGNMDNAKSMCADYDTFGTWYLAFGGTGYAYGKLA